ncbi:MAG: helix-turn-helix domain-containing protein [Marinicellaceae bacterium]
MKSQVYNIKSDILKPYIQYILFNQNDTNSQTTVKSYPNTNICLGISKGNRLLQNGHVFISKNNQDQIFAYTTGLYNTPRKFQVTQNWDEICIDFHPSGYFHFFGIPSMPQIIDNGFSSTMFSCDELNTLNNIFEESNLNKRSIIVEDFLISKLKPFTQDNLQLAIKFIHHKKARLTVKELLFYTKCSERKMYQLFLNHFGVTPKQYIRILKIRNAIQSVVSNPQLSLTQIAYNIGYSDQSHFIKEARLMCEILPKEIKSKLISIDSQVIVSI